MGAIGSISECFLFSNDRVEGRRSRDLLEGMKKVMVCLKVVCIHVDAESAIESGLFGRLEEELVVMVDATDDERVDQFETYGKSMDHHQIVSPTTSSSDTHNTGRTTVGRLCRIVWKGSGLAGCGTGGTTSPDGG